MVLRFTFLCYTTKGRVNVASFIFDVLLPNTWQKWPTSITIVVVRKLFDNRVMNKLSNWELNIAIKQTYFNNFLSIYFKMTLFQYVAWQTELSYISKDVMIWYLLYIVITTTLLVCNTSVIPLVLWEHEDGKTTNYQKL